MGVKTTDTNSKNAMLNINPYLEDIATDIRSAIDRQNLGATGRAKGSIKIRNNRNIVAIGYISTLFRTVGRRPGKFVPIRNLIQWIIAKGIQPRNLETGRFVRIKSLAFAISKTIQRRGTRIFRDHRRGIQMKRIIAKNNEKHIPLIARELKNTYVKQFNSIIVT